MIICKLKLDKRRIKKDGSYPLVYRIATKNTSRDISTGFSIHKNHWNYRTGTVKENYSLYDAINPVLKDQQIRFLNRINEYQKLFPNNNDIQAVKEFLIGKDKDECDVYSFWEAHIDNLKNSNRIGGAQVYQEALVAINKIKSLKVPFQKVDFKFLNEVETAFLNRGVKQNTIGIQFRALRAIFNKAINSKIISYEYYPFRSFKIKKGATIPRTISLEDMKAYFNLNIENTSYLYDSWLFA